MIRTYTVDSNKFFQLISPGEDEIKASIAFVLDGLGIVRSVNRPLGMQYIDVIVESSTDVSDYVLQGFYNVGYTSAVMVRTAGGVTSTNLLGESVQATATALAPALGPLSRYVLVLVIAMAVIVIAIFAMKGGKQ